MASEPGRCPWQLQRCKPVCGNVAFPDPTENLNAKPLQGFWFPALSTTPHMDWTFRVDAWASGGSKTKHGPYNEKTFRPSGTCPEFTVAASEAPLGDAFSEELQQTRSVVILLRSCGMNAGRFTSPQDRVLGLGFMA